METDDDNYFLEEDQLQLQPCQLEDVATQVDFAPPPPPPPPPPPLASVSVPPPPVPRKRKRSESSSVEESELVKKALLYVTTKAAEPRAVLRSETDRYSIFGQYVACELKEIGDADMERWARQQITTILCQAQSGNLPSSNSNHSNQNNVLQNHSYLCGPFFRSAPCLELSDSSQPASPNSEDQ